MAGVIEAALRIFNHEIIEAGLDQGLLVVDPRRVYSEPGEYGNPIGSNERKRAGIGAAVVGAVRAIRYDLNGEAVTIQGTGGMPGGLRNPASL